VKVIIAGSRTLGSWSQVFGAVAASGFGRDIEEVIVRKQDERLGEHLAEFYNVPKRRFSPSEYDDMLEFADALIAVWDGSADDVADFINKMAKPDKLVYIYNIGEEVTKEDALP
jgi:hypothetical protein